MSIGFIGEDVHRIYNFSMNLREMLRDKNITISKLSRVTGISESRIRNYSKARAKPTDEHVELIATALGCIASDLTDKEYDYSMPGYDD